MMCLAAQIRKRIRITYLESCKVNDIVNVRMFSKDFVQLRLVCYVDAIVRRPSAGQQLNSIDDLIRRVVQVVDNDNLITGFNERKCCEGANIASASAQVRILAIPTWRQM